MTKEHQETPKPNRMDRRRQRTRGKLIEGAKKVFSQKGIDATSVHDITEEADVGIGSFYTYFPTKDDIVAGVAAERLATHAATVAEHASNYDDATVSTVMGARTLVHLLLREETFDWLLERPHILVREIQANVAPIAIADAKHGVEQGAFNTDVDDPRSQMMLIWGLVGFIATARETGLIEDADKIFARAQLRLLGADEPQIDKLMELPLPDLG